MMSGGWSVASITSAASTRGPRMLAIGPATMLAGLLALFVLMPMRDASDLASLAAMGLGLGAIGAGIGMCWPHLGAAVFANAPEGERDLASASITTVIMVGNAFGSALGGMVTNVAHVAEAPSQAAAWLFALFALAPVGAALAMRRLR
jgi:predicted MFS family arabinose efflux permease